VEILRRRRAATAEAAGLKTAWLNPESREVAVFNSRRRRAKTSMPFGGPSRKTQPGRKPGGFENGDSRRLSPAGKNIQGWETKRRDITMIAGALLDGYKVFLIT